MRKVINVILGILFALDFFGIVFILTAFADQILPYAMYFLIILIVATFITLGYLLASMFHFERREKNDEKNR